MKQQQQQKENAKAVIYSKDGSKSMNISSVTSKHQTHPTPCSIKKVPLSAHHTNINFGNEISFDFHTNTISQAISPASLPQNKEEVRGSVSKKKIKRKEAKKDDDFWNTESADEREKIRLFWAHMDESQRKELVKLEKEAVLSKMKNQQKFNCACSICGKKRLTFQRASILSSTQCIVEPP
jgi:hypothetical protein